MFTFILILTVIGEFHSPRPLQKSILTFHDKQLHLAVTNAGIGCSVEAALYPTPWLYFRSSSQLQVT